MNIGYVKAPLARPDYSFHEGKGENASRGEPARLNGRKVGDILTSLGLMTRSRTNRGYVLWLGRADRLRIHKMVRDYAIDDTARSQDCDICEGDQHGVVNE